MAEDQGFLRAAREAPDDDTPRLVYADWLEEHDDPRGEFIRLQCTLAKMSRGDPGFRELEAREGQMRAKLRRQLVGPKKGSALDLRFSRGLLENVTALGDEGVRQFLARAPGLFQMGLESVSLMPNVAGRGRHRRGVPLDVEIVQDLAQSPWLGQLRKLHAPGLDAAGIQVLAASPHLTWLRSLNLSGNRLEHAARQAVLALLESPSLGQVTTLKLSGSHWRDWYGAVAEVQPVIGPEGVRALAGSPHAERLRTLDLSWNDIDDGAAEALARSPHLANLDKLFLEDSELLSGWALQQLGDRFGDRICFQVPTGTWL